MTIQYIEKNGQHEYAIVPMELFNELREKAEDMDDLEAYEEALKDTNDEWIPADIVHRLLNGENTIKVWREYRGLTQGELAKKTGLAQPTIAQLETGVRKGSVAVLKKLAAALSVDLDDLV